MSFGDVYALHRLAEVLRNRVVTNIILDKLSGEKKSSFQWNIPTEGCTEKTFVDLVNKVRKSLFATGEFKCVQGWVDFRTTEVTFHIISLMK